MYACMYYVPSWQAPGKEHVYLVGCESGSVYQCSKAYGSDYLASFDGHCMPVYSVKWNSMHPDMFLSCSADWSIKVRGCTGCCGWLIWPTHSCSHDTAAASVVRQHD